MAVLPMKRVLICALKKDRKPILELLQRMSVVQVESSGPEDEVFAKQDRSEAKTAFQKNADTAQKALELLDFYVPQKKTLAEKAKGRQQVSVEAYEKQTQKRDETMQVCRKILALEKERAENAAKIPKLDSQNGFA
jgi:V/A-type H+-transporting ATPase subunit I